MKSLKLFFAALAVVCIGSTAASAQGNVPEKTQRKGFEFTTVKANPITAIRNQGSSGTCWAFSTTAFFESEAIRKGTADTDLDLSEMYTVRQEYLRRGADYYYRRGKGRRGPGGISHQATYWMERAGLMPGDKIVEIDGTAVKDWNDVTSKIDADKDGHALHFVIDREGKTIEADISPEYLEDEQRYVVGIVSKYERDVLRSIPEGIKFSGQLGVAFVQAIVSMFKNGVNPDDLAGPVGLVRAVDQTSAYGLASYLMLLIIVSLNLAFFNLLPIPGLDGGKIFFIILKVISGGRITDDMEYKATIAGIILLITLAVLITFNDVRNIFG